MEALEREKMSQSPIDFLSILIVIKNPLLQLMKSVVARSGISWVRSLTPPPPTPCHLPPTPCHLHPTPPPPTPHTPHNPHPSLPMDNMHGNLRFYYVQQPCLDYVLFLGFFEVISFSLSDISSGLMVTIRGPCGWDVWPPHSLPESTQTCIPFSSHVIFRNTSLVRAGEGALLHHG